jgi:hypothetical protein
MTNHKISLEERLAQHPKLRAHIETILNIAEANDEHKCTADEIEEKTVVELRKLGSDVMHDWAKQRASQAITEHKSTHTRSKSHKKKAPTGTPRSGKSK